MQHASINSGVYIVHQASVKLDQNCSFRYSTRPPISIYTLNTVRFSSNGVALIQQCAPTKQRRVRQSGVKLSLSLVHTHCPSYNDVALVCVVCHIMTASAIRRRRFIYTPRDCFMYGGALFLGGGGG